MTETRQIVVPGEIVATSDDFQPGQNTYLEGRDIRALRLGVKTVRGDRVNVISLNGRYEPFRGDMVIGTVVELGPSNWYINVGAANDVGMHVNDVPWRVEFGETSKYLDIGDTVLLKIVHVDEMKKAQVSMKDRQCRKLTGGLIWEVSPSKVPRIVGRNGSMIGLLKDYTSVRIFVGQNGIVWLDGEPADVNLALEALHKIEAEAHTSGLTDRMKAWFEERRPGAADRKRALEAEERGGEEEEEFRPSERRPRPRVERSEEDEEEGDRPPRRERSEGGFGRGRPERGGPGGRDRERGGGGFRERGGGGGEERPRRFREDDEERPPRRERGGAPDERPRRMRDDDEERPPRRERVEERPRRPRDEDEGERPARRAREDERPARRPRDDDEEERPRRRLADDEDTDERPARRERDEGGRERHFGGGREGGGGRRRGGRGRGRGGRGGRED